MKYYALSYRFVVLSSLNFNLYLFSSILFSPHSITIFIFVRAFSPL